MDVLESRRKGFVPGLMTRPTLEHPGKKRMGIKVEIPQPCGCRLDLYFGGKGYLRGSCIQHQEGQPIFICPINSCGRLLHSETELRKHRWEHGT